MKVGRIISGLLIILGFIFLFSSLTNFSFTGAVIGETTNAKILVVAGIGLVILGIIVEKYNFEVYRIKNNKKGNSKK